MRYVTFKRIYQRIWFIIANLPMPGHGIRPFFVKMGGVQVLDYQHTFIGQNVDWDTVNPEKIVIERGVRITESSHILTHFIDPQTGNYTSGEVRIKEGAFIGTCTIITKPITIGQGAVIGAGSVVTKNVPDYEVWGGNPAHFIRKIEKG